MRYFKYIIAITAFLPQGCDEEGSGLPVNNAPIPRILEFSPGNVVPGGLLTISGMNFSSDITKNEVKFNQTVVPIESASESEIRVVVPDLNIRQVGISVRSNGKISNRKILSLAQIKRFSDDFDRAEFGEVGIDATPNPFGADWLLTQGRFGLKAGRASATGGGFETLMFYQPDELDMVTGEGNFFKLSADLQVSPGSFAGIVFNAQADKKRFYLLRMNGPLVQFLKTGPAGLGDWARVVFSEEIPGFSADTPMRVEISSSNPGQFLFKVVNMATNAQLMDRTVTDENPYVGGVPGFYYFGLANPVSIWFDNLNVELQ